MTRYETAAAITHAAVFIALLPVLIPMCIIARVAEHLPRQSHNDSNAKAGLTSGTAEATTTGGASISGGNDVCVRTT